MKLYKAGYIAYETLGAPDAKISCLKHKATRLGESKAENEPRPISVMKCILNYCLADFCIGHFKA
jgi:hypothetical protein